MYVYKKKRFREGGRPRLYAITGIWAAVSLLALSVAPYCPVAAFAMGRPFGASGNVVSDSDNETIGMENASENVVPDAVKDGENNGKDKEYESDGAPAEAAVPIYHYSIADVVVPAKYAVALNPYRLPVDTGANGISTSQVVARNYGMINKSSTDQIVTVTLTVEDMNSGKITFVDSEEEAKKADSGTYAVYLEAIPAADAEVGAGDGEIDQSVTAEDLSDVSMTKAKDQAVVLHEGENHISFKLSKANYRFKEGEGISLDSASGSSVDGMMELEDLAPDGGGVTAFTFGGAANPGADWGKLEDGIRISVSYTYETADGSEEIIPGTDAMVNAG